VQQLQKSTDSHVAPSRLAEIMIETSSKKGELVLDMFAGSGSTVVAAKKLGRSCLLIEKTNCKMYEELMR
jgi:DNA modification methylase